MKKVNFVAYAVPTVLNTGAGFDHTFVVAENDAGNWGCFGRGKEAIGANGCREIARGLGWAEWAGEINGKDPNHPCGSRGVKIDGVCQNIANRLLALAGCDVSGAAGSASAILLYGKYGFGIDDFIKRLEREAERINQKEPNAIPREEIEQVINRIQNDRSSDEIHILGDHFKTQFSELNESEKSEIQKIYSEFRGKREEEYAKLASEHPEAFPSEGPNNDAFQKEFATRLARDFVTCLEKFKEILGAERYVAVFKLPPALAAATLFG